MKYKGEQSKRKGRSVTWCVRDLNLAVKNSFVGTCRIRGMKVKDTIEQLMCKYVENTSEAT